MPVCHHGPAVDTCVAQGLLVRQHVSLEAAVVTEGEVAHGAGQRLLLRAFLNGRRFIGLTFLQLKITLRRKVTETQRGVTTVI